MSSSVFYRARFAALSLAILAFAASVVPCVCGQENPAANPEKRAQPAKEFVISNGTFERRGQRVPASLRNVVEVLVERYPHANITIVGADDTRIGDITLRWGRRVMSGNEMIEAPLNSLLAALKAASNDRFNVDSFSPNDFVITKQNAPDGRRTAEVFKLGPLIAGRALEPGLQRQLEEAEAEREVQAKRYVDTHPKMVELADRIAVLKRQQARMARPPEEGERMLAEIQQVVRDTLQHLAPGEPPPEFRYHAGTGLLVVIGSEAAIDVTRKVVAALH